MAVFTNSDIKKRRELLKMTAATLAEMIGRDPTTIYNWESGQVRPRAAHLPALAALRAIGKREACARLERLRAKA